MRVRKKKHCRESFEKMKKKLSSLGICLKNEKETEACIVLRPKSSSQICLGKENIFLIGEAAGFISPSSFEGISSAFLSGKYLADAFASESDPDKVLKTYKKKTAKLRLKLFFKIPKMKILCSPLLRKIIMKSGICSIEKY